MIRVLRRLALVPRARRVAVLREDAAITLWLDQIRKAS